MLKKESEEIFLEYKQLLNLRNEKLKFLKYKDEREIFEFFGRMTVPLEEDLMLEVLKKHEVSEDTNIYINRGLFLIKQMYSFCERAWKISESDVEYLEDLIKSREILEGSITEKGYNLESGKEVYSYPKSSIKVTLPIVKELREKQGRFIYGNRNLKIEKNEININVLRTQYFINKLNGVDVDKYYSDEKNYPIIEEKMKEYERKSENNRRLVLKSSQR